jgi:hypothetical protein
VGDSWEQIIFDQVAFERDSHFTAFEEMCFAQCAIESVAGRAEPSQREAPHPIKFVTILRKPIAGDHLDTHQVRLPAQGNDASFCLSPSVEELSHNRRSA